MLTTTLTRSIRTRIISTLASKSPKTISPQFKLSQAPTIRTMASHKPNSGPPAHEMVYFPRMTTSLPSSSAEFRKVLFTGLYSQVVLMTIPVDGDIGDEVHTVDQALTFTSGEGLATINGKEQVVKAGDLVVVPAGTQHQFVNTGATPLILYTIYSPAEHNSTTIHHTKEEGDEEEENGKDEAPEWTTKTKKQNKESGAVKESGKY